jgi:hypothetical protein
MSYLENGSTLRAMFRLMPPLRHDIDPGRSEVLAYIKDNLRCDIGKAIRSFNSMRHVKSAVLIYDRIHRQWRGCDWVPAEEVDKVSMLLAMITEMKRDISSLRSEDRKLRQMIGVLRRRKGGKAMAYEEEDTEEETEPQQQQEEAAAPEKEEAADPEEWFRAMRAALAAQETSSYSAPSVEPPSSPSGYNFPTKYRWVSAEGLVPLT